MEKRLILRGLLAGAVGGVLAFGAARMYAEPLIQRAIDYEEGRAAAEAALQGGATGAHEAEVVSRAVQQNVGLGVGMITFGVLVGGLFAVAYALCLGRTGAVRPRPLALLVGLGGFVVMSLVPFLKYPANPPAVGSDDTVGHRTGLFLVMLVVALLAAVLAVAVGQGLRRRFGVWNAALVAGAGFALAVGVAMAVLPSVAEVPLPLRDKAGAIAFPGFPADVLAEFRFYTLAAQAVLWAGIAVVFAPLADNVLTPPVRRAPGRAVATVTTTA